MTKKQRIKLLNLWSGGRIDAVAAYASMETLRKSGRLTAERLLDAATAPAHPLHGAFEWNDQEAAHEYRLEQARRVIRAVVVEDPATLESTRVYIHVPAQKPRGDDEDRGGFYERAEVVVKSVDMFTAARDAALQNLKSAQARMDELHRFSAGDEDRMSMLAIVSQALSTAEAAIGRLH